MEVFAVIATSNHCNESFLHASDPFSLTAFGNEEKAHCKTRQIFASFYYAISMLRGVDSHIQLKNFCM